jgi:hypothetical protein
VSEAYSGPEPVTAPGIHDMPRGSAAGQPSPKMMRRFGEAFVNRILASVLYALAGIQVFGVNPFGFLRAWADDLAQRADDAYNNAAAAQDTADTALQLLGVSDMDDSDSFARADDDNLGTDWFQRYESGVGKLGVKNESAHWYENGGAPRWCHAIRNTALSGDDGLVRIVVDGEIAFVSTAPDLRLIGRSNAALDTYVIARIHRTSIDIGYAIADAYTQLASTSYSVAEGLWEFKFGVGGDSYAFALLHNGDVKLTANDTLMASQVGALYRLPGFGHEAGNGVNPFGIFEQKRGPDVQAWATKAA